MKLKTYKKKRVLGLHEKMICTLLVLLFYRFLSHIPLPFVDSSYIKTMIDGNGSLSLFDAMTGGNLSNMTVVALGITPYITASIVLQLLGVVFPAIAKLQQDGSSGQKKMKRITMVMAVVFGGFQSVFMLMGYGQSGVLSSYQWYTVAVPAVIMVLGVFVLSFLGQFITDHLFGNGISLLLVTGILCSYFGDAGILFQTLLSGHKLAPQIMIAGAAVLVIVLLFAFTIWLNYCEKRIVVTYSGRMASGAVSRQQHIIPLKLIGGSVVPVIFASSVLTIPSVIQSFTGTDIPALRIFNTSYWLSPSNWWASIGMVFYFAMIIWFGYYYQALNLNEIEISEKLKQNGGMIAGVRPGKDTAMYLRQQMRSLTFLGGLGLCVIAFVPILSSSLLHISNLSFLGTSIIIVVSVINETYKLWQANRQGQRSFAFYKKTKPRRVFGRQVGGGSRGT